MLLLIGPIEVENALILMQMELIDFQNDSDLKDRYQKVVFPPNILI